MKKRVLTGLAIAIIAIAGIAIFLLTKEQPAGKEVPTTIPTVTVAPTAAPTAEPTEVPHEHEWTTQTVSATCTEAGYTVNICECGEEANPATIPPTGHTTEKVVVKEPTVDEEGMMEEVCTVCGEVVKSEIMKKLIPTEIPKPTETPIPTATPTPTPTVAPTPTVTPTVAPTNTPVPTATATPKPTATPTPIPNPKNPYLELRNYGTEITMNQYEEIRLEIKDYNRFEYEDNTGYYVSVGSGKISDKGVLTESGTDRYFALNPGEVTIHYKLDAIKYNEDESEVIDYVLLDTLDIHVTVLGEPEKNPTITSTPLAEYDPVADGYNTFVAKADYGNYTVEVWTDEESRETMIIKGEGIISEDLPGVIDGNKYAQSLRELHIGEGITEIHGFCGFPKVNEVAFPSTLKIIGDSTFKNLKVKELVLPEGLQSIGSQAFMGCDELEKINLPSTLKYLGGAAFSGDGNLKEVTLPKDLKYVGAVAFVKQANLVLKVPKDLDTSNFCEGWDYVTYFTKDKVKKELIP